MTHRSDAGSAKGIEFRRRSRPTGESGSHEPGAGLVFNLNSLGWKAFQDLCGTVLGTILGQTVQAFRPTRDEGRDFAFEGRWSSQSGEFLEGQFVVQAKFKARANFYRSDLTSELSKIRRLIRAKRCDSYILMTNAGMTAATEAAIKGDLEQLGVNHSLLIGGDQLDRYLRESPRLRALVPRLYGLGDLTQILDERQYVQAKTLLFSMREDIDKFVITAPYRKAISSLLQHGFVLLTGAPASGKSMIAAALTAASIDMWGSNPVKCENANAFSASWNPSEPTQLFWIDDAFGTTQYVRQRADDWNQLISTLKAAVSQGTRVVMTTRDYIWAEARDDLKLSAFPLLSSAEVVIDVHDLKLEDKIQILYNHLKFGAQPSSFKQQVKPYLLDACRVKTFLPEVARRFGDPQLTPSLVPTRLTVVLFFEHPIEHLQEVVRTLGTSEFAALALLYMSGGSKASPIRLDALETQALDRLGSNISGVSTALEALRGSLVVLGPNPLSDDAGSQWTFKHPTISEAVHRQVENRPELLQIFLVGSPLSSLLTEVTCGDVGLAGALVVPDVFFELVAARIQDALGDDRLRTLVTGFVVTRCSPAFVHQYATRFGGLSVNPTQAGSLRIAAQLYRLGLLSKDGRTRIVAFTAEDAADSLDVTLMTDSDFLALATDEEQLRFLDEVHAASRDLDNYLQSVDENYSGSEDPDDVIRRVESTFQALHDAFPQDLNLTNAIGIARQHLDSLDDSLREKWEIEPDPDWGGWDGPSFDSSSESDIFDDVDQ